VYVVPTNDMLVKSSKHVDPSGECSFEYLDNWRKKSEVGLSVSGQSSLSTDLGHFKGCNLQGLIEVMQEHFSRDPPVYAKPKGLSTPSVARPSSVEPPLANRPPPPLPISAQPTQVQPGPNRVTTPSHRPGGIPGTPGPPVIPPKVHSAQQFAASPAISPVSTKFLVEDISKLSHR
jgi:ESCRT-I complex subunit TSG101